MNTQILVRHRNCLRRSRTICHRNRKMGCRQLRCEELEDRSLLDSYTDWGSLGLPPVAFGAVAWGDFDNDGLQDLALGGQASSEEVVAIYHNNGDGTFANISPWAGWGIREGSIACADYNNDGLLDFLVTGNTGVTRAAFLYQNDGGNHFTQNTAVSLPGIGRSSVAWGDVNNDGRLDFVMAGHSDSGPITQLYLNQGGGNFTRDASFSPIGIEYGAVAFGDYDTDGRLDLIVSGQIDALGNKATKLYRNIGGGTFNENSAVSLPGVYGSAVAWGDYDSDGRLDLFLAGYTGTASISKLYHNEGDGTFTENTAAGLVGMDSGSAVFADHNNDGRLDLLMTGFEPGATPASKLYSNNGAGHFIADTSFALPGVAWSAAAFGQFDNDNRLDFILTGRDVALNPVLKVFHNSVPTANASPIAPFNLSATPADATTVALAWGAGPDVGGTSTPGLNFNLRVGTTPGGSDIVNPQADASGHRLLSQRGLIQGTQTTLTNLRPGQTYYWSVQSIDTGLLGSAFATEGSFTLPQFSDVGGLGITGAAFGKTAWGDYDNDGRLDVFVTGENEAGIRTAKLYHNRGDGTFQYVWTQFTGVYGGASAWGDYDRDGRIDLLVTGYDQGNNRVVELYHNDGGGVFTLNDGAGLDTVVGNGGAGWGDYDNDGRLDLVLSGWNGGRVVTKLYRNLGTGAFAEVATANLMGVEEGTTAWGDYNNDGRLDLLLLGWDNSTNPVSTIYRNNGDGTFTQITTAGLTGVFYGRGAWGDYDNDGYLDIAMTGADSSFNHLAKIYHNNSGNGTFTEVAAPGLAAMKNGSVACGDYDADGRIDLLLAGDTGGANYVHVYHNDGSGEFSLETSLTPLAASYAAWGDYDGNGALDLLLTGRDGAGTEVATIYRNLDTVTNTRPNAPASIGANPLSSTSVSLSWTTASDTETPSLGVSYNLRVGTTPGGTDIVDPMADANGLRRIPQRGMINNTNWRLDNLIPGQRYYWSVQTVDSGLTGSAFATERSFVMPGFASQGSLGIYGTMLGATDWCDYNNDGLLDLVVSGELAGTAVTYLYQNDGASFHQVYAFAGLRYSAVAWGDYDNDGRVDLVISGSDAAYNRTTKLYRNLGTGSFQEIAAGFAAVNGGSFAWGDYNNDGRLDLLQTGFGGSSYAANLYRNNGNGTFTLISTPFAGVSDGSVDWGDYDLDGRLDVLLTGYGSSASPISKVYHNDGNGAFHDIGASLAGVVIGNAAWGDYDNDGRLDIALTGRNVGFVPITKIYHNNGGSTGVAFQEIATSLPGGYQGKLAWGDYDSDGRLDLALTGGQSYVLHNDGNGAFSSAMTNLTNLNNGSSPSWADYNNDGKLDLLLVGRDSTGYGVADVYRNILATTNTAPSVPASLSSSLNSSSSVTLAWAAPTDAQTPAAGLSYSLRVGTTPGGIDVVGPTANTSSGFRRVAQPGPIQTTSWTLEGLTANRQYYWSVQAVDTALTGGTFATEGLFFTDATPPTVTIGAPSAVVTASGPITYSVTYADPNFVASTLDASDVLLAATGTATGTVHVSGSGTTYTVTIDGITGDGTLGISIAAGTAYDLGGNYAPAAGPSATFAVENTGPYASILALPSAVVPGQIVLLDASDSWHPRADRDITRYVFDFGDGGYYVEFVGSAPDGAFDGMTTHAYANSGNYVATVVVTDNGFTPLSGISDTSVQVVGYDFGDAIATFPVTSAENGARHVAVGPRLGGNRDTEADGIHSALADFDDGDVTPDDEDGVSFSTLRPGESATFTIDLQQPSPTGNYLSAWIDYNQNGSWNDAGEQIFTDYNLGSTSGSIPLSLVIPWVQDGTYTQARFRLSSASGLTTTGAAPDGEVEDYRVFMSWANFDDGNPTTDDSYIVGVGPVHTPNSDYGDAPDSYGSTTWDVSAWHRNWGPKLGSNRDLEPAGLASVAAGGDDSNNLDDDDGVSISPLGPGVVSTITVNVTGEAGKLDAFFDWNQNGNWDDPGEQVFASRDVAVGTNVLTLTVPDYIATGTTFARFRLSSTGGLTANSLAPGGTAPNGEVEDYQIVVQPSYELILGFTGTGIGRVTSDPAGIDLGDGHFDAVEYYLEGTVVSLTATAGAHSHFVGWSGGGTTGSSFTVDVVMNQNRGVWATFDRNSYLLNVNILGSFDYPAHAASIVSSPAGINYPVTGTQAMFPALSMVTVTATPAIDAYFAGWTGDATGTAPATVTMTGYKSIGANFFLLPLDYGDAPVSYNTIYADDAARHVVGGSNYLGSSIDADTDGVPNSAANGDDSSGTDDEDGVVISSDGAISIGYFESIDLTASADAKLDGWIDFNRDGDWLDVGEQIFTSKAVTAGPSSLVFQTPISAQGGNTYARFRLSSAGGLGPTGPAADGEVEDYRVFIDTPPVAVASPSHSSYVADLGASIQFNGTNSYDPDASEGDSITTYTWLINGGQIVLYGPQPTLAAMQVDALGVGVNVVSLQVTDGYGMTASDQTTLVIYDNRPVASFTANPNPVTLSNSMMLDASASEQLRPDRQIVSYVWQLDFPGSENDQVEYGAIVGYVPPIAGWFTATLTVADDNEPAKTDSLSQQIYVNAPPHIVLGGCVVTDVDANDQTFSWQVTDLDPVTVSVVVKKDGATVYENADAPVDGTFNFNSLGPGAFEIRVYAIDEYFLDEVRAGGSSVIDDDPAPPAIVLSGSQGMETDDQDQGFTWNVSDTISGLASLDVSVTRNGLEVFHTASLASAIGSFDFNSLGLGDYVLTISATDADADGWTGDALTATSKRSVTVTDDDTTPPAITLGGSSGSESHMLSQVFTWDVEDQSGIGNCHVSVTQNGGLIYDDDLAGAVGSFQFDAWGLGEFVLTILAPDADADHSGDSLQSSATRVATVTNATPADVHLRGGMAVWVDENAPSGADVGPLTSTDADPGEALLHTYSILEGPYSDYFQVVGTSLQVAPGAALNYEAISSHYIDLTMRATDTLGATADATFRIHLNDVNESPTDIQLNNLAVQEHVAGASVGNLTAIDPDAGDHSTFTVGDARFEVVVDWYGMATLQLKPGVSLDYGSEPTVSLDVTATDSGGLSCTETFTLTVLNINDPPSFALNYTNVSCDEDVGLVVIHNFVRDVAAGPSNEWEQGLTFTVTPNSQTVSFVQTPAIDPDTGDLTFQVSPNDFGAAFDCEVVLRDDGSNEAPDSNTSAAQHFTLTVSPVNDAPTFALAGNPPTVQASAGPQTVASFASHFSAGPANESDQTLSLETTVTGTTGALTFSAAPAIDLATGNLTYTASPNAYGTATVQVTLRDSGSNVAPNANFGSQTFTITVQPTAPVSVVNGNLIVRGTSYNDTIVFLPSSTGSAVTLNGKYYGPYKLPVGGRLIAYGNEGRDIISVSGSTSRCAEIYGGPGNDSLAGGNGSDSLYGEDGIDTLRGNGGADFLSGGGATDLLYGGDGNDRLDGGAARDSLWGDGGDDVMRGGDGDDWMSGGLGADILQGLSGNDTMFGDAGRDLLIGGVGVDELHGGTDEDILIGGVTKYADNDSALMAILAEWKVTTRSNAVRRSNITIGLGLTQGYKLDATTVADDSTVDTLIGDASSDWLFARLKVPADRLVGASGDAVAELLP